MTAETADVPPPVVDPRVMRDVLGHFASGVTVVTSIGPDGPIGFTCQSFSSLSQAFARSGTDKYAGVAWAHSPHGSPVLDGVVAWIDSEVWAEYEGGDHTIVVGRVLDLGADEARSPLVFHRGSYGLQAALEAGDESPAG
jgi:3-hydroxy-9,10-secoandrosta-1,3,5(10)-triene-9,17-dione monooxygenase reductase component